MVPNTVQPAEVCFERAALGVSATVGLFRDLTEVHLHKWGLTEMVDDVLVVVSELVTNAVMATPRQVVGLRVRTWRGDLVVEVHDTSPCDANPRPPDFVSLSGRGLHIVAGFARQWGQCRLVDGTKYVYAIFAIRGTRGVVPAGG